MNDIKRVAESFSELLEEPVSEKFVAVLTEKQRAYIHFLLCSGGKENEKLAREVLDSVKTIIKKRVVSPKSDWYIKQRLNN